MTAAPTLISRHPTRTKRDGVDSMFLRRAFLRLAVGLTGLQGIDSIESYTGETKGQEPQSQ